LRRLNDIDLFPARRNRSADFHVDGEVVQMVRSLVRCIAGLLVTALLAGTLAGAAAAQSAAAEPPPQVRELLQLLDGPVVRQWLEQQRTRDGMPVQLSTREGETTTLALLAGRVVAIREHLASLVAALPTLPDELRRVGGILGQELKEHGAAGVFALLVAFVGLGFGAEWLFRRATVAARRRDDALHAQSVSERLRALTIRLAIDMGTVIAFAAGSIGAFLLFQWPPVLREIVLGYLVAFLALRVTLVAVRFLLAPSGGGSFSVEQQIRIVPMSDDAARFWFMRIGALVGWFAFGYVTISLLDFLGLPPAHRRLVAYTLGLGLLAMGLEIAWRRPGSAMEAMAPDADAGTFRFGRGVGTWLLSIYFLLLWFLWVAHAMNAFWFAAVTGMLPAAIRTTRRAVTNILLPPGTTAADEQSQSVRAVCIERGLRATLIVGAVVLLAYKWDLDLVALTASDTLPIRLVRGVLTAIVILLIANFAWHVMKVAIDRKLVEAQDPGAPDSPEARRRARLRTLLPILRNVMFVVLIAMAAMMALASLGVEIGPLIAGAGVVGVAIGFGAQTLVRDVISGMFYLLDDAFRVGEYIQSGNYMGTVESFSLRSVKLRHHRGPLYTVPFGELGAVQNMSRDWVIDKLTVGVTYDTDLEKARKLVKEIGKQLAMDPEFAPNILEPLKMQGVEKFGEYAIQIRMKMKTRPGEQFVVRRRAYGLIKKAFDANGIKFAFPTVQVAGESDAPAALAHQALSLVHPQPRQPDAAT
jgi:small-conductance mechanosensitive channel